MVLRFQRKGLARYFGRFRTQSISWMSGPAPAFFPKYLSMPEYAKARVAWTRDISGERKEIYRGRPITFAPSIDRFNHSLILMMDVLERCRRRHRIASALCRSAAVGRQGARDRPYVPMSLVGARCFSGAQAKIHQAHGRKTRAGSRSCHS